MVCVLLLLCAADAPSNPSLSQHVGKDLKISGATLDGKDLSTEQWKGKVVLVDFWATWCAPCVAELPRVKKLSDQYHDKGFEVLCVASDYKPELLKKFLAQHPEYTWPQLFDPKAAKDEDFHPAASALGIEALPAMILIDKKGVCRSVGSIDDIEAMVPKLLAE
jgi:thiol-disulfide isomerase/thioredoxin